MSDKESNNTSESEEKSEINSEESKSVENEENNSSASSSDDEDDSETDSVTQKQKKVESKTSARRQNDKNLKTKSNTKFNFTHKDAPKEKTAAEIEKDKQFEIAMTNWHKDQIRYKDYEIRGLRDEVKTMKHELFLLTRTLKHKDNDNTPNLMAKDIEVLKIQIKNFKEDRLKFEKTMNAQHDEVIKLKEANKVMKKALESKGIDYKKLVNGSKQEDLGKKLEEKNEEINKLNQKVGVLSKAKDQVSEKLSKSTAQIKSLQKDLAEAHKKIEELASKNAKYAKLDPLSRKTPSLLDEPDDHPALHAPVPDHGSRIVIRSPQKSPPNPALTGPDKKKVLEPIKPEEAEKHVSINVAANVVVEPELEQVTTTE